MIYSDLISGKITVFRFRNYLSSDDVIMLPQCGLVNMWTIMERHQAATVR